MYVGPHVQYPLFLSDFNENCIFSTVFSRNPQISNFIKIRPVGAELIHANGRTDGQTWRSKQSLFAILRRHLITWWSREISGGITIKDNYLTVIKLSWKIMWNFWKIMRLCNVNQPRGCRSQFPFTC